MGSMRGASSKSFAGADLDAAGLKILEVMAGLAPSVQPHLMSPADYGLPEDVGFTDVVTEFTRDVSGALARCSNGLFDQEEPDARSPLSLPQHFKPE